MHGYVPHSHVIFIPRNEVAVAYSTAHHVHIYSKAYEPWNDFIMLRKLSSYVLDLPNDSYTALSQNFIGCSTLSQEYCKLIGLF